MRRKARGGLAAASGTIPDLTVALGPPPGRPMADVRRPSTHLAQPGGGSRAVAGPPLFEVPAC
jgi:hypothetical protein